MGSPHREVKVSGLGTVARRVVALVAGVVILTRAATPMALSAPAGPQDRVETSVGLESRSPTVQGCGVTRVEIWVRDVADLYGADVRFKFDPGILRVVDADPGSSGVQLTPLGGFLKPDFVARKIACNVADPNNPDCAEAGFVWYAVTQTSPNMPVSGSGPLVAVDFVAIAPGASSLEIVYSKIVDRDGMALPGVTRDGQLTGEAPTSPAMTIRLEALTTAALEWPATGAPQYRLFRDVVPYFTPANPPYRVLTLPAYADTGAVGDPTVNHFYVVESACATGFASSPSNRVGEFDFTLLPGEAALTPP